MKKPTYRIRDWSEYNAPLKQRRSLTIRISSEAVANWTTDELTREPGVFTHMLTGIPGPREGWPHRTEPIPMTTTYDHKGKGWTLTAEAFEKLLDCFDVDRESAGEKYEDLRRALVRYFEGRRILFAEEHVDEVFNRVSRRLIDGVQINNLYSYCYEVARRVLLERQRSPESRMHPIEEFDLEYSVTDTLNDEIEKGKMLSCLNQCLEKLPPESRALITEYYQHNRNDRVKLRKAISERLNLSREALANRAQRLRAKLEKCIEKCLKMTAI